MLTWTSQHVEFGTVAVLLHTSTKTSFLIQPSDTLTVTWRSHHLTVPKCPLCIRYQATLRVLLSRQKNTVWAVRTDPSSRMNDRWRTTPELKEKVSRLRQLKKLVCVKLQRAEAQLHQLIHTEGVQVRTSILFYGAGTIIVYFVLACRWMTAWPAIFFKLWKIMHRLFPRNIPKTVFHGCFGTSNCKQLG